MIISGTLTDIEGGGLKMCLQAESPYCSGGRDFLWFDYLDDLLVDHGITQRSFLIRIPLLSVIPQFIIIHYLNLELTLPLPPFRHSQLPLSSALHGLLVLLLIRLHPQSSSLPSGVFEQNHRCCINSSANRCSPPIYLPSGNSQFGGSFYSPSLAFEQPVINFHRWQA